MRPVLIFYDALGHDDDWESILAEIMDFERGQEIHDPRCFDFFVTPRYLSRIEWERAAPAPAEGGE